MLHAVVVQQVLDDCSLHPLSPHIPGFIVLHSDIASERSACDRDTDSLVVVAKSVPAYFDELRVTVCGGGKGKGCGKKARFDVTKDNRGRELFTVPTKPYCGGYKHECEG